MALYFSWYDGSRPHTWLRTATPDEVYHHRGQPAVRLGSSPAHDGPSISLRDAASPHP
jgi:hypothetical protein